MAPQSVWDEVRKIGGKNNYVLFNRHTQWYQNGSIDNTHPTDSGFLSMAQALGKVFEKILR